jgi:uncharacterized repeat protein (TIGR01451 family)
MNVSSNNRRNALGRRVSAMLCLLAVAALPLPALAAPKLDLKTEAFREVEQTGKDGKKTKAMVELKKATPGDKVIYVITYHNIGNETVDNVKVDNPVPKGLIYEPGSAQGAGTRFEVSIDGGHHYGQLETMKVTADGQSRPARAEDVTNVRWTLTAPLKPEAQGSVSYRALLP